MKYTVFPIEFGPDYLDGPDRLQLGQFQLPGKARVTNAKILVKRDKKPVAGKDGAQQTTHGVDPQPLEIAVFTWKASQREIMRSICREILPLPRAKKGKPLAILSEQIDHLGISAVIVLGGSEWKVSGPGQMEMTIYCEQSIQATGIATHTPKGAPERKPPNKLTGTSANSSQNAPPPQQVGIGGPNFSAPNFQPGA
jgi:hypothetical protein